MLHFYLLGQFRIEKVASHQGSDPIPVALPRLHKTQSLLVYLLAYNSKPHPRERLAGLFWPESAPASAQASLSTALNQLRSFLQANEESGITLQTDRQNVVLKLDAAWLDLAILEKALSPEASEAGRAAGLDLYGGDLYEDCSDDWCIEERERLRRLVLRAGTDLARRCYERGAWTEGIRLAEHLLQFDPLDEMLHELLLRLFLGAGDYSSARRHYTHYAAQLRDEYGAEPSPSARQIYSQALGTVEGGRQAPAGVPAEKGSAHARSATDERTPGRFGALPSQLPFVGRSAERLALAGAIANLRGSGKGSLVVVRGEPGVGKTRMIDEVIASSGRIRVARGRAYELGHSVPFSVLIGPLATWLLDELAPQQVLARLGPTGTAALAQVLPMLAARIPGLRPLPSLPPEEARTRLIQSVVAALLASVAPGSPAILLLDDLQWADPSTLRVLEQLRPRLAASPLLVIGSMRSEEADTGGTLSDLAGLAQREGGLVVDLRPLSRLEVQALVEPRMPQREAALSSWLYTHSGGSPFYVAELMRALQERGVMVADATVGGWKLAEGAALPSGSQDLDMPALNAHIMQRFSRLDADSQKLGRVAVVLGEETSFDLLATASGLDDDSALTALDELISQRFVSERAASGRYVISHDLIRQAVYTSLSTPRRRRLHEQVGAALERALPISTNGGAPAETSLADLLKLTYHYEQTSNPDKQLHYYKRVIEASQASFANEITIDYYRRLMPLLAPAEQINSMLKLAALLRQVARRPEAEAQCSAALRLAESIGNLEQATAARLELASVLATRGAYTESIAECRSAFDAIHILPEPDPRLLMRAHDVMGENHYWLYQFPQAIEHETKALELARELSDPARHSWTLVRLGAIYTDMHDYGQALNCASEALEVAERSQDVRAQARALFSMAYCYQMQGHLQPVLSYLLKSWECVDLSDFKSLRTAVLDGLAQVYSSFGEYEKACPIAIYAVQVALDGNRYEVSSTLLTLASLLHSSGRPHEAEACLQRSLTIFKGLGQSHELARALGLSARILEERGEHEQALSLCTEALGSAEEAHAVELQCEFLLLSITLRHKLNALSTAEALAECRELLGKYREACEQAAILLTIWRIDAHQEDTRRCAAEAYQRLLTDRPNAEYALCYRELTGCAQSEIPALPDLSALPPFVPQPPISLSSLLATIDQLIGS